MRLIGVWDRVVEFKLRVGTVGHLSLPTISGAHMAIGSGGLGDAVSLKKSRPQQRFNNPLEKTSHRKSPADKSD